MNAEPTPGPWRGGPSESLRMTYRVSLTNPDTLLYCGASWEHVRREIRDYRVLVAAGLLQDRELTVCPDPITVLSLTETLDKVRGEL